MGVAADLQAQCVTGTTSKSGQSYFPGSFFNSIISQSALLVSFAHLLEVYQFQVAGVLGQ